MKRMGGILSPKVMIDDLCSSEFQDQDGNRSKKKGGTGKWKTEM